MATYHTRRTKLAGACACGPKVALYLVDNAGLRSTTAGLRFRNSPVLQDGRQLAH